MTLRQRSKHAVSRQHAARAVLALFLLAALALLFAGIAMVWEKRGATTALAIFPGIPLGAALLVWLVYQAFDE